MAKKLQILRGTTAQNDAYTGSIGELTMDTEKVEVRIHDGTTQGGKTIGSGGGASLPILTHVFSDHKLNDISWLNADTFSWQSGDVYKAAYEHLVSDIAVSDDGYITTENGVVFNRDSSKDKDGLIAWTSTDSTTIYTSNPPIIGETPSAWDDNRQVWGAYGSTISSGSNVAYQERISNITITYYKAEDGHKICLPDQESNVQALYEETGIAWYYILDTKNKQFKLPRTKFGFTGLRDSVGGYVEAGLPNITGTIANAMFLGNNGDAVPTGTGAFKVNSYNKQSLYQGNESNRTDSWAFDASRSSSIYGNSNTVQPEATQMYLYFYVGNFEREAIEQTAGITSEQLNSKADISNVQALETRTDILEQGDYVVASQKPTSSNGYTWYRKYKSGWVEQGGRQTGNVEAQLGYDKNLGTITLPIPMQNSNYYTSGVCTDYLLLANVSRTTTTLVLKFVPYEVSRILTTVFWYVCGQSA